MGGPGDECAVTVVGVIATLWGAIGWFRDVLPVQRLEPVRVEPTR
jgi:hypothetical protein